MTVTLKKIDTHFPFTLKTPTVSRFPESGSFVIINTEAPFSLCLHCRKGNASGFKTFSPEL